MMAPRILSLLSMFETALRDRESPSVAKPGTRLVSFHRSIARLTFADGSGDVVLQCFTLADGQTCIKMQLRWASTGQISIHSLYPQGNFQWEEEVGRVADAWTEGPPAEAPVAPTGASGLHVIEHLVGA